MSCFVVDCRKVIILQWVAHTAILPPSRETAEPASCETGSLEGYMTAAPIRGWHTAGREHMPSAVRKAEARSPAPGPVSQVAADSEARFDATSGA